MTFPLMRVTKCPTSQCQTYCSLYNLGFYLIIETGKVVKRKHVAAILGNVMIKS